MANVKSARTREIRQRIEAAAAEEFAEKGYEGASMTSIAVRAGIALRTLYYYAPRKDLLFFDPTFFDDIIRIVRDVPLGDDVLTAVSNYLRRHRGRYRELTDREAKAFESLMWTQLEEQLTELIRAREAKSAHAIVARTEAAMIVLIARSLHWVEFESAERGNKDLQKVWLDLTSTLTRDFMLKTTMPHRRSQT